MKRIRSILVILTITAMAITSFPTLTGDYSVHAASAKKPARVKGLKVKARGSNYITLKWNKVKTKGTKGYILYMYNTPKKKWQKIKKTSSAKKLTFKKKGLKANTKYKFKIRAYTTYKRKGKVRYRYGRYSAVLSVKTKKKSSSPTTGATVNIVKGTSTGSAANPAPSTPKLVSNVTSWNYDKDKKQWKKNTTYDYTYNECGDPATINYNWVGYRERSDASYTYKYRLNGTRESASYKETGVCWNSLFSGAWISYTANGTVSYDKNGRVTTKKVTSINKYDSGESAGNQTSTLKLKHLVGGLYIDNTYNPDYSYKVTAQNNGIIKQIERKSGISSSPSWRTYCTFFENGLIKKKIYFDEYYTNYTYKYNKETGLVESATISTTYEGDTSNSRIDFEYSTTNCSRERYISMINSSTFLENEISFLWY